MIPKFRAYHPEYGIREVVGLYWYPDYLQVSLASGIASPIRTSTRLEGLKLMQFTGLCDSYGQEIYEGDILTDEDDETYEDDILTDEWDDEQDTRIYGVVYWDTDDLHWCVDWQKSMVITSLSPEMYNEIAGNIYENPELLGDTNDE